MHNSDATGSVKVKEGVAAENLHHCSATRGLSVCGPRLVPIAFSLALPSEWTVFSA